MLEELTMMYIYGTLLFWVCIVLMPNYICDKLNVWPNKNAKRIVGIFAGVAVFLMFFSFLG